MAGSADRRDMPSPDSLQDAEPPQTGGAPNLFAPISAASRITGNSRVRRQHSREQMTPGSTYDFGRDEEPLYGLGFAGAAQDAAAAELPQGIPSVFLRRTWADPKPLTPDASPYSYGLRGVPTPDALMNGYLASAPNTPPPSEKPEAVSQSGSPLFATPRGIPLRDVPAAGLLSQAGTAYPWAAPPRPESYRQEGATYDGADGYPPYAMSDSHAPSDRGAPYAMGEQRPAPQAAAPYAARVPRAAYERGAPFPVSEQRPATPTARGFFTPDSAVAPTQRYSLGGLAGRGRLEIDGSTAMQSAEAVASETVAQESEPAAQPLPPAEWSDPEKPATHARRRSQRAQPASPPTDTPAQPEYQPRHGGRQAGYEPQPMAEPGAWPAHDWPEPAPVETTSVWRVSDVRMFQRGNPGVSPDYAASPQPGMPYGAALDVPAALPGGSRYPEGQPDGYGYAPPVAAGYPYAAEGFPYPAEGFPYPAEGYPGEAYGAYPTPEADAQSTGTYAPVGTEGQPPSTYPPASYGQEAPGLYPSGGGRQPRLEYAQADGDGRTPIGLRERFSRRLATIGGKRLVLYGLIGLGMLFCLIEGFKMVPSLWANEQEKTDYVEEYYALTGETLTTGPGSVELLPPGVTYAPSATPTPVQTPTASPRIAQNDPLIGVMDAGGQATDFQPALPAVTPATRTRLTKYPDNALLSVGEAFTDLRAENPDVVGTLRIPGVLDEVLVQHNNTFYLNHNARGTLAATGAVFVDESCSLKKPPENLLLRGQAGDAAKLFGPLLQYESGGTGFISQHGIVTCDTIYEQANYVIFAVLRADGVTNSPGYFNYAGYPTFQSDTQMLNYVAAAKQQSLYRINVGVRPSDRLLTLATLSEGSDTESLVILCRMLRSDETATSIRPD